MPPPGSMPPCCPHLSPSDWSTAAPADTFLAPNQARPSPTRHVTDTSSVPRRPHLPSKLHSTWPFLHPSSTPWTSRHHVPSSSAPIKASRTPAGAELAPGVPHLRIVLSLPSLSLDDLPATRNPVDTFPLALSPMYFLAMIAPPPWMCSSSSRWYRTSPSLLLPPLASFFP